MLSSSIFPLPLIFSVIVSLEDSNFRSHTPQIECAKGWRSRLKKTAQEGIFASHSKIERSRHYMKDLDIEKRDLEGDLSTK